eukprot:882501_1
MSFYHKIISKISEQIANLKHQIFINQINEVSTINWTVTKNVLEKVNSHYDTTVRMVMALDYLTNMGFKSKKSQKALKQNQINLPLTMQFLIKEFSESLKQNGNIISPFISKKK